MKAPLRVLRASAVESVPEGLARAAKALGGDSTREKDFQRDADLSLEDRPNETTFSMARVFILLTGLFPLVWAGSLAASEKEPAAASPYTAWKNGPPPAADFFPIAVWLQNPNKAQHYKEAGFNTYVGLWRGPTEEQLASLRSAGMKVICSQNQVALAHVDDPAIIAWMHGDEPDNAQSLGQGKGYGPPIPPDKIIVIHGSRGLIYFVHEWEPKFNESALLSDPEMLSAVTAINRQISQLAPVLNRPTLQNVASVTSENHAVPIAIMLKQHEDAAYLFAVGMRGGATRSTFKIKGVKGERAVEVLGENRTVPMKEGLFQDGFQAWDAHIYRFPVNKGDDL